ncbi:alpha/beta fold hydrolase [Thiocystis violacea]|uniref:alpha/beta fold hydrolase n=1 Tax=Thiocystis violacea TaxID=13725 RepID=UPI001905CD7C|nr:alpha/beta hydrolase [Thiocystis violacea]MBK1721542.1 hypothetical protein [Thiocystis violacea]
MSDLGAMLLRASLLLSAVTVAMVGCVATHGELAPDRIAAAHGMQRRVIHSQRFEHLAYMQGDLESAREVHLYLEGDGVPWRGRYQVSPDPTPRNPLALRLMALDPAPSVYLGRPCYFGFATADGCNAWLWTHARYGPEVVESLVEAIERLLPPDGGRRLTLVGYSGGGVLAALVAPRLKGRVRLVTLAANLDIDAWADRHGYSRLSASINPADQPPIDRAITQLHLMGSEDREVPPATIARFIATNRGARTQLVPGYDHRCCWIQGWPGLLDRLDD